MRDRRAMIAFAFFGFAAALAAQEAVAYPADAPKAWKDCARTIAARRGVETIELAADDAPKLRDQIARRLPRTLIVVAPPSGIDHNRHRRLLDALAAIDADPFVDAVFGYVTGRTPDEALAFHLRASAASEAHASVGMLGVTDGVPSRELDETLPLGTRRIPFLTLLTKPKPGGAADLDFIRSAWPRFKGRGIVILGGHGYPDRIVGGPGAADLGGADFSGAIVLNIACFNGVTGRWFDPNGPNGRMIEGQADPENAMALAVLRAGAKAHVASLSVRPAGPELIGEAVESLSRGLSLGELRRRDHDRVVIAALEHGLDRLPLREDEAGRDGSAGDFAKDVMLDWATGMALFGDPSLRPFKVSPGDEVLTVKIEATAPGETTIRLSQRGDTVGFAGADPLVPWDDVGTSSMRLWARIPWDGPAISSVALERLRLGKRAIEGAGYFAIEDDDGRRFLHLKVRYSQKEVLAERFLGLLRVTADLRVKAGASDQGPRHGRLEVNAATTRPNR